MKASAIEFRLRMAIMAVIITLGFWAPWIPAWGIRTRIPLLEWLPLELSRHGLVSFSVATPIVIALAALIAAGSTAANAALVLKRSVTVVKTKARNLGMPFAR